MKNLKALSKRGLALLVALLMCVTMLPMSAFAAESEGKFWIPEDAPDLIREYIAAVNAVAEVAPTPSDITTENRNVVGPLIKVAREKEDFLLYDCEDETVLDYFYEFEWELCLNVAEFLDESVKAFDVLPPADDEEVIITSLDEGITVTLEDGTLFITGSGKFTGWVNVNGEERKLFGVTDRPGQTDIIPGYLDVHPDLVNNIEMHGSAETNITVASDAFGTKLANLPVNTITLENVKLPDKVFSGKLAEGVALTAFNTQIGRQAFENCALGVVSLSNVEIDAYAFSGTSITGLSLGSNVKIGFCAFSNGTIDGTVDLAGVTEIGPRAFWDVKGSGLKLVNLSSDAVLAHSNTFVNILDNWESRMTGLLAGKFQLEEPRAMEAISPDGWTSAKEGQQNDSENVGGTQATEEARWADTAATVADVRLKAYATDTKQMDFVFVMDSSGSMNTTGDENSKDSRFANMQSKVFDVTQKLLTALDFDSKVALAFFGGESYRFYEVDTPVDWAFLVAYDEAIVLPDGTFIPGDWNPKEDGAPQYLKNVGDNKYLLPAGTKVNYKEGTSNRSEFVENADEIKTFFSGQVTGLFENTNYVLGLQQALELVEANKETGRNTTVIFISDGQPNEGNGTEEAAAIKAAGAQIYSVLQSVPADELENAEKAMKDICTDGKFFTAADTEGFSKAVNEAVYYALKHYTMTWEINPAFTLNESTLKPSVGTSVEVSETEEGNQVVTWLLGSQTYAQHTLDYQLQLNRNGSTYPAGTLDVNAGDAELAINGGTPVNIVATPQLSRSNPTPPTPVNPDPPATRYTVNWEDGDGNIIKTTTITGTDVPASLYPADPEKEDVSFLGWGEPDIVGNVITIIAEWDEDIGGNDVPLVVAPGLDSENHYAYIIGYGDGTVRPTRNITRAEVATIFYRLMTDDFRAAAWSQTNDFADVNSGDWFNNAVSTSAEAGLLMGYGDGTFQGKRNITRAEFAAIAARFIPNIDVTVESYPDTVGHWAEQEIRIVTEAGWFQGDNGMFRPNDLITRAEAMTVVNRMLNRVPHAEDLLEGEMTTYPDNQPGAWYYAAVQEATNSHDYEMGERDGETVETWTNMKPNRDWAALEKEWSDAYSGSNGTEVA